MSIATIVIFRVKAGRHAEFEVALGNVLASSTHDEGFIRCDRYRDPKDPQRYVLHEIWASSETQIGRAHV